MRTKGFTLIELLVVIAIIAILAALLMPALEDARTRARVSACLNQQHQLNLGIAMYLGEFNEWLPYTWCGGNVPSDDLIAWNPAGKQNGLGLLYGLRYVPSYAIFYCPGATQNCGWGPTVRENYMNSFDWYFTNGQEIQGDYVLGWWSQYAGPDRCAAGSCNFWFRGGAGPEPCSFMVAFNPGVSVANLNNYKKERTVWLADGCETAANQETTQAVCGWYPYGTISHDNWRFNNVGRIDGSCVTVQDYRHPLPADFLYSFYWPNNERPGYGYWWWMEATVGLSK